jgi:hypothetical protein
MNMQSILTFLATWVPIVVTAAAAAMAVLPQGKPGSIWDEIRSVVNYAALNFGHATNAVEKS